MEIMTYDPTKVAVGVGGRTITGFANDGVVSIAHTGDKTTPTAGAQGDIVYSENADNSGTATLSLMSTSASLAYLRDCAARRREVRFDVIDQNSDDPVKVSCERCRVVKVPEVPRGREQATVSVPIFIPDLNVR